MRDCSISQYCTDQNYESVSQLRVSPSGAPRTVRFSTRDIDFRIDGNVVISMCGHRYSRCPVCGALFAINRSLYRRISDLAGSSSGRSCSDRIRSAIAHNTNRMFRGRTRGDRLRTHHVGSVRSARSRTGIPVLRCCKRYFPHVRTVPCPVLSKIGLYEASRNVIPVSDLYFRLSRIEKFHANLYFFFIKVTF